MLSFTDWMRRPVYAVQCFTTRQAWQAGRTGNSRARYRPEYRDAEANAERATLALALRAMRAKGVTWRDIRQQHPH